jgi:hypothetical protein
VGAHASTDNTRLMDARFAAVYSSGEALRQALRALGVTGEEGGSPER